MDNKKQNYSGAGNSKASNQATDSNRQKSSYSDIQTSKHWPKNSRRRENPSSSSRFNNSSTNKALPTKLRPNVGKRTSGRGSNSHNSGSSYREPNENCFTSRSGLRIENTTFSDSLEVERFGHTDYELNSVYTSGSKKQNLNHLLNFYYTPREMDYYDDFGSNNGYIQRHNYAKKNKYNKEQFLQANFQFVIKASAKNKTDDSPDTLIDWSLIEQINIQTPDEPQCPICLYPPIAAKVTRCGHVYCWPCVLHYLSLTDKTWRKCPICYEAIHVEDLKSASIVQQQEFNLNSFITFHLMCRKKGSLFIEKYNNKKIGPVVEKYPYASSPIEDQLFSKFILAKRNDVANILARERKELLFNVDEFCPEYVFIQQAVELLKERTEKLGENEQKGEENKEFEANVETNTNDNFNVAEHAGALSRSDNMQNDRSELTFDLSNINNFEKRVPETSSNIDVSAHNQSSLDKKSSTKFHYFYQSDDGQNIYLHPLNVKMLQACYGSLADAPSIISARIIQKEQHSMDEDHRRKFTCLGHLPLTCQFAVVEIELQHPYVTEDIIQCYKGEILSRKQERQRRAIEERKREKHINDINERKMGKIIASAANINISSCDEFPTCGFEELLAPPIDFEGTDNIPSSSKGCRTKTISTSSAGNSSYSAIALHCKNEHTPWSNVNAAQTKTSVESSLTVQTSIVDGETSILSNIHTNLGDVLAQALSQKDRNSSIKSNEAINVKPNNIRGNKKSKKSKKMLPLYSTGMNFSTD